MRFALLALAVSGCCFNPSSSETTPPTPAPATVRNAKAEREVDLAQKSGWLTAVNCEKDSATVTPKFRKLSFDVRQATAANVAAACMGRTGDAAVTVGLFGDDGRKVGVYTSVLARLTEF